MAVRHRTQTFALKGRSHDVRHLAQELGAVERQRAQRKPTQNLNAWDCYHLGLSQMYRFDREGNLEAQRLFRRATAFDPEFAFAHARLAYCIVLEMVYFDATPTRALLDEALPIAKKAVLLDDKDAFCHLAVARVHLARREYNEALAECRTSLELNPSLAQAHCAMGDALSYTGRVEETIVELQKSIQLSPQDPWRWRFCLMKPSPVFSSSSTTKPWNRPVPRCASPIVNTLISIRPIFLSACALPGIAPSKAAIEQHQNFGLPGWLSHRLAAAVKLRVRPIAHPHAP